MMGIGFGEMVLIAGIALIFLGPEKFPEFAKIVMRTIRDLRGYMDDIKDEVSKELRPVQKEIRSLSRYDPETYIDAMTGKSSGDYDTAGKAQSTPGAGDKTAGDTQQELSAEDDSPADPEAQTLSPRETADNTAPPADDDAAWGHAEEQYPEPPERLDG